MQQLIIKNGRVIDPANGIDEVKDLYLADGKVVAETNNFTVDETIDANGKIVMPGAVDLYANLCEPGFTQKATIATETHAARQSGITSLCCPPTTNPIIDTPAVIELIAARAEQANFKNIFTYGALTQKLQGTQLCNLASLKEAGCVAVTNANQPIPDTTLLRHSFDYAATYDLTVVIMAQDSCLSADGVVHEGEVSARTGLSGIPSVAETIEIARCIALAEFTGTKLHFTQISTAQSVELIKQAKTKGLPVTADVSINHLMLSEIDVSEYNTNCFILPPLRSLRDQHALIQGLQEGVIDAICSGHAPHENNVKLVPFNQAEPGISCLEVLLPLSYRLVAQSKLSVSDWVAKLATNPAKIMQLPAGSLTEASGVVIFDPTAENAFKRESMLSAGKNTPYHDWHIQGAVDRVIT